MEDRWKVGMRIIRKSIKFYIAMELQTRGVHYTWWAMAYYTPSFTVGNMQYVSGLSV